VKKGLRQTGCDSNGPEEKPTPYGRASSGTADRHGPNLYKPAYHPEKASSRRQESVLQSRESCTQLFLKNESVISEFTERMRVEI
jgi:hypothetical protein